MVLEWKKNVRKFLGYFLLSLWRKFTLMQEEQLAIKTSLISVFGNLVLAIVKALAGVFGNSQALIADAIESTGDVFSSILVYFGFRYAKRPADKNHPYGHGRIEPLVTFLIVIFLVIAAVLIVMESIENIQTPHSLPSWWTLLVLAPIILWKEITYRIVLKRSNIINSSSLKADAWHHRSDAITSIAAFIGISIALWMGEGYESADDWAALLAAGIILYNSYVILRPALREVMDEQVYDDLIVKIRKVSKDVEGVGNTEKCFVRKTGLKFNVDLHVHVDGNLSVSEGHDIAHELKAELIRQMPEINEVLIHIEPMEV